VASQTMEEVRGAMNMSLGYEAPRQPQVTK
jgi:hypothetical protein